MIFLKLAWRNMRRNKRRTIISGLAIGFGLCALVFMDAVTIGMQENMFSQAADTYIGHAEIHNKDYRQTLKIEDYIHNLSNITKELDNDDIVQNYSVRVMSLGMVSSPSNVSAVNLIGVNPENERYISLFDEGIIEGNYFEDNRERSIVIGKELAENLDVKLGDKIVATASGIATGELVQEMFRITGIFDLGSREMNAGFALIRIEKARQMLVPSDSDGSMPEDSFAIKEVINPEEVAHEIAIRFTDYKLSEDSTLAFWNKYSQDDNIAQSWQDIMPTLVKAFELAGISRWILGIIVFGIVIFVIWNSLFMSLYERIFEFGVLRAVGTRPFDAAKLVIYEAFFLSLLSIVFGMLMSLLMFAIFGNIGLDYTGTEFMGVAMQKAIYPRFVPDQFITYPLIVILFTVLISLYPARYAAKIKPSQAMRKSF